MNNADIARALRKVFQWSRSDWEKVTALVRRKLKRDALNGILQTGRFKYKSQQYVKYKQNYFRRYTFRSKGKRITGTKLSFNKKTQRVRPTNTKIKAYQGISVKSNHVANVNMMVTGQTYDGLKLRKATKNSAIMQYAKKDRPKIEGNPDYRINELSEDTLRYTSKPLNQSIRRKFSRLGKVRIKQIIKVI